MGFQGAPGDLKGISRGCQVFLGVLGGLILIFPGAFQGVPRVFFVISGGFQGFIGGLIRLQRGSMSLFFISIITRFLAIGQFIYLTMLFRRRNLDFVSFFGSEI